MVSEVQVDDERMVRDLLKDDNRNRGMRGISNIIYQIEKLFMIAKKFVFILIR